MLHFDALLSGKAFHIFSWVCKIPNELVGIGFSSLFACSVADGPNGSSSVIGVGL